MIDDYLEAIDKAIADNNMTKDEQINYLKVLVAATMDALYRHVTAEAFEKIMANLDFAEPH